MCRCVMCGAAEAFIEGKGWVAEVKVENALMRPPLGVHAIIIDSGTRMEGHFISPGAWLA